ncbi:hypothetical protein HBB16_09735 [Pseudonocardia sp. MCCB 268]|nr:hypothetical protein [Pseudonocardia cytotoxica]
MAGGACSPAGAAVFAGRRRVAVRSCEGRWRRRCRREPPSDRSEDSSLIDEVRPLHGDTCRSGAFSAISPIPLPGSGSRVIPEREVGVDEVQPLASPVHHQVRGVGGRRELLERVGASSSTSGSGSCQTIFLAAFWCGLIVGPADVRAVYSRGSAVAGRRSGTAAGPGAEDSTPDRGPGRRRRPATTPTPGQ